MQIYIYPGRNALDPTNIPDLLCKHMQGQRVKWLEQNLVLLKSTLNSILQLYTRFEHKWRNFVFLRVSFLYFFHSIFILGSTSQTLVSAQWKGDLPTYHALRHYCTSLPHCILGRARGRIQWGRECNNAVACGKLGDLLFLLCSHRPLLACRGS